MPIQHQISAIKLIMLQLIQYLMQAIKILNIQQIAYFDQQLKIHYYKMRKQASQSIQDYTISSGSSFTSNRQNKTIDEGLIVMRQRKLSDSFSKKKNCEKKITLNNFREILGSIARSILGNKYNSESLLQSILVILDEKQCSMDESINSMLIKISYKRETIDLMTSFKDIQKDILEQITRKENPIYKIIFYIWYKYLLDNMTNLIFQSSIKFRQWLKNELNMFTEFIANAIYHFFSEWFYHVQKKNQIYSTILKTFVPQLITSHKNWKIIYKHILRLLGQRNLTIPKQLKLTNFDIEAKFNCIQLPIPFQKTIRALTEVYEEYSLKKKIIKLKQLANTLKNQIFDYQEKLIQKLKIKRHYEIDVDNMVSCFTYCVFKSEKIGIAESLEYLEIFFQQQNSDGSQYLQDLQVGHLIASVKSAVAYLRYKDNTINWSQTQLNGFII